jgi:transforming growth factor-beta-induced protein
MTFTSSLLPLLCSALVSRALAGNIAEELILAGATTLADLVVKAGLDETLATSGPFTVFAPDNEAFSKLPESTLEALGSDMELLKKVLLYHVVSGEIPSSAAKNNVKLDSIQGAPILVNLYLKSDYYDGFITINGKKVKMVDMKADNGVIHCVSDVLYPIPEHDLADTLIADERFSTLVTAATAAGLVDVLRTKDLTIFAPTNEAFAKIPSDALEGLLADKEALTAVLLRHALPGSLFSRGITWQEHKTAGGDMLATQVFKMGVVKVVSYQDNRRKGARVEEADIIASNGVIHAIDTVI